MYSVGSYTSQEEEEEERETHTRCIRASLLSIYASALQPSAGRPTVLPPILVLYDVQ